MMGGTTGVVTYLYCKFGNIWIGVIPAAMFAGIPDNIRFYTMIHNEWEDVEHAYYALAETEVCTYMNKFSIGVTGQAYMPEFFEKALKLLH